MTNKTRKASDGKYHIHGKTFELLCGSRAQVAHGTAYKTKGYLTNKDLFQNKHGKYVSMKKHKANLHGKSNLKSYLAKKGSHAFVLQRKHTNRNRSKRA